MCLLHVGDDGVHTLRLPHVQRNGTRLPAAGANLRRCGFDALELPARQHDVRTERREEVCYSPPDPASAARDERDLSVEEAITKHGGLAQDRKSTRLNSSHMS